jgi:hypothetical protein
VRAVPDRAVLWGVAVGTSAIALLTGLAVHLGAPWWLPSLAVAAGAAVEVVLP